MATPVNERLRSWAGALWGSCDGALVPEAFQISYIRQLRQTKVENLGFAPMSDENVRRLDVTMDDAFFVSCGQPVRDLNRKVQ